MDQDLLARLPTPPAEITVLDAATGLVRLPDGSDYTLKPLRELYAPGANTTSIDTGNSDHLALLLTFERTIVRHAHADPGLADGGILLSLEHFALNPEADPKGDGLTAALQLELRKLLSVTAYDRQMIRLAARRLVRSAQGHSKRGGRCGYLDFIHAHVPHGH